jgi:hypothetical protein
MIIERVGGRLRAGVHGGIIIGTIPGAVGDAVAV